MNKRVYVALAFALSCLATQGDEFEQRPACSIWTENVVTVAKDGWRRNKVQANRSALRKLPEAFATQRGARIVESDRLKVDIETSDAKAGSYSKYRGQSTFAVTFQKLPCGE